ncbi:MAG: biotin transporter BioY [Syntrophomonadaceae bacterium]|jgi:biotin transport system substrate-specific component
MRLSTQELVRAAMFTAMMCVITVLVRIFQPVIVIPFSLQPLVMLLAACLLSPRAALLSMLAYLLLGLVGLPVFSVPPYGGPAYVLIPSFGFLLGFPLAAWLQSRLIKKISLANFILAGVVGVLVYYAIGLPYMYLILNFYLGHSVDLAQVLKIGFLPFLLMDIIKIMVSSVVAVELCRRFNVVRGI